MSKRNKRMWSRGGWHGSHPCPSLSHGATPEHLAFPPHVVGNKGNVIGNYYAYLNGRPKYRNAQAAKDRQPTRGITVMRFAYFKKRGSKDDPVPVFTRKAVRAFAAHPAWEAVK